MAALPKSSDKTLDDVGVLVRREVLVKLIAEALADRIRTANAGELIAWAKELSGALRNDVAVEHQTLHNDKMVCHCHDCITQRCNESDAALAANDDVLSTVDVPHPTNGAQRVIDSIRDFKQGRYTNAGALCAVIASSSKVALEGAAHHEALCKCYDEVYLGQDKHSASNMAEFVAYALNVLRAQL